MHCPINSGPKVRQPPNPVIHEFDSPARPLVVSVPGKFRVSHRNSTLGSKTNINKS